MFTRRDVFTECHLPREMPGRGQELSELSDVLRPAAHGEPAASCWEIGPSGAGKTTAAKFLLEDLRDNWGVGWSLVECVGSTHWELLRDIAADHPRVPQHRGLGIDDLVHSLEQNSEAPFIVVLDEFDGLDHPELLAELEAIEWISLICIGHDLEDSHGLVPDEAESMRRSCVIEFDPYSTAALIDILEARREVGLRQGAVADDHLERIAGHVGGSARYAVQALRSAVELGVDRGHTEVQSEDVDDCFEHAKERIRRQLLSSLSRDHHQVYRVIREGDGLTPTEIYERYCETVADPNTRQAVIKYRKKLDRYDLIEETDGRWQVVDDTLKAEIRRRIA